MFYENYAALCARRGISPSRAAEEVGLNRSAVVKWRRGAAPAGATLQKLSEYFGVPVGALLGEAAQLDPAPAGGATDEEIKFALFGGGGEITDAMYDEVKRFARLVRLREEAEKKE